MILKPLQELKLGYMSQESNFIVRIIQRNPKDRMKLLEELNLNS